jgi:hypothetical protein
MKYRAVAEGLKVDDRQVQIVGQQLTTIEKWATAVVKTYKVIVRIYMIEERLLKTVQTEPTPPEPCSYNHDTLTHCSGKRDCPGCGQQLQGEPEEAPYA